jgi:hypothetical protein
LLRLLALLLVLVLVLLLPLVGVMAERGPVCGLVRVCVLKAWYSPRRCRPHQGRHQRVRLGAEVEREVVVVVVTVAVAVVAVVMVVAEVGVRLGEEEEGAPTAGQM